MNRNSTFSDEKISQPVAKLVNDCETLRQSAAEVCLNKNRSLLEIQRVLGGAQAFYQLLALDFEKVYSKVPASNNAQSVKKTLAITLQVIGALKESYRHRRDDLSEFIQEIGIYYQEMVSDEGAAEEIAIADEPSIQDSEVIIKRAAFIIRNCEELLGFPRPIKLSLGDQSKLFTLKGKYSSIANTLSSLVKDQSGKEAEETSLLFS